MKELAGFASIPEAFFARAKALTSDGAGQEGRILFRKRLRRELAGMTWEEAADRVRHLAAALIRRGLERGARVALMADNGPLWAVTDLGVQAAGGIVVPVYCTNSESTIRHIVHDSDVAFFFAGTRRYLDRVSPLLEEKGSVAAVLLDEKLEGSSNALDVETFLGPAPDSGEKKEVDKRIAALTRDQIATVIYTSGTTGPPKGVLLSHGNLLANIEAGLRMTGIGKDEVFLSILPMSHSFERTAGFLAPLLAGATIHFAQSVGTLARDIVEARPTLVLLAPRFLEKLRQKIASNFSTMSGAKGILARWALGIRLDAARRQAAGRRPGYLARLGARLSLKVIGPAIRDRFGGRLRLFLSGGAALSAEVWAFFEAIGVKICQGYGLTETAPAISINPPDAVNPTSVGRVLDNVEVKIAPDGEILARGPSIMKGYHNLPDATAEVIDGEGFFHTGDVGFIDEDGFLFITDRKKDIIVSAGGKNIAPQNVENTLCEGEYIEFASVFGEGENFLAAILSPDMDALKRYAGDEGIAAEDPDALVTHPRVAALFQAEVERANGSLAAYERIARHHVARVPFSVEGGEITTTLKVRRPFLSERYAAEIEKLFSRD